MNLADFQKLTSNAAKNAAHAANAAKVEDADQGVKYVKGANSTRAN